VKNASLVAVLALFSAISALAQQGKADGQLVMQLDEVTFTRTSVANGHRSLRAPAIAGATEVHWLVASEDIGPNAKAFGADRILIADFSNSFMFPGLRGSKAERRNAIALARRQFVGRGVEKLEENRDDFKLSQVSQASIVPNDPMLGQQQNLDANGVKRFWADSGLSRLSTTTDVKVVVMDSGIEQQVLDLAKNVDMKDSRSFIPAQYGSALSDPGSGLYSFGHGTPVAGVIGAVGNNGTGIAGIDWNANLVSYRVFYPVSAGLTTSYEFVLKAFIALMDLQADHIVVNCSFSEPTIAGDNTIDLWGQAIDALGDRVLVVAAAGNDGDTRLTYPAAFSLTKNNVISVAALDQAGGLASYSNHGWADIGASGDVYSTANDGSFQSFGGTSLATPNVAGVANLLWKLYPNIGSATMKKALLAGQFNPALVGGLLSTTNQLNLQNSITALQQLVTGTPAPAGVKITAMSSLWSDAEALTWGGIVTIWGNNLSDGAFSAHAGKPLPTQLGNTAVLVGQADNPQGWHQVPLLFVGQGQINIVLPMNNFVLSPGQNVISVVRYDNQGNIQSGAGALVTPVSVNPGFLTRQDGKIYTFVSGGQTVVYAAGLGVTSPALTDGVAGTGTEQVVATVQVLLDGVVVSSQAVASSAGAGVYEVRIPTPPTGAKTLTIKVGEWRKDFVL